MDISDLEKSEKIEEETLSEKKTFGNVKETFLMKHVIAIVVGFLLLISGVFLMLNTKSSITVKPFDIDINNITDMQVYIKTKNFELNAVGGIPEIKGTVEDNNIEDDYFFSEPEESLNASNDNMPIQALSSLQTIDVKAEEENRLDYMDISRVVFFINDVTVKDSLKPVSSKDVKNSKSDYVRIRFEDGSELNINLGSNYIDYIDGNKVLNNFRFTMTKETKTYWKDNIITYFENKYE